MSESGECVDAAEESVADSAAPLSVGCRVQDRKTGDRGVVLFMGEVQGTQDTWLGVDWDDASRGKHNGTRDGISYFNTRLSTSGSFVRPGKVMTGVDLVTAVRNKYQAPPPDTAPVEQMLQQATNARFVQFVGWDKVSKKQSMLETIRLVDLKKCLVFGAGPDPLSATLPRLVQLHLTACLIRDWSTVASIVEQLPRLQMLNISENRLELPPASDAPSKLHKSFSHVGYLVMNNMINYDWQQLLTCADMFPNLHSLQVAFNSLRTLGPVPIGSLSQLRLLDVGANPLRDFSELWHLSQLPRLEELNINSCELPCVKFEDDGCQHSTQHFKSLTSLYIANNPLDNWKSVCQLSRLASLENLTFGLQIKADDYFPEFIYAIIRTLKMLNRTQVTVKEKRDYELFYLKKFSCPYYDAGGSENPTSDTVLNQDFVQEHPTFLQLAIDIGAPFDERGHRDKSQAPLKDQMLKVSILLPDGDRLERTLMPSVKISRLKMMLRRSLKLPHSAKLKLSYTPKKSCRDEKNIPLDCDYKDVGFFSLGDGDTIHLSW